MTEDRSNRNGLRKRVRYDLFIARVIAFLAITASVAVSLVLELEDNKAEFVLAVAIIILGLSLALILILVAQVYAAIERLSD